jgi:hypothetical protein
VDAAKFLTALAALHGNTKQHRDCTTMKYLNAVQLAARWEGAVTTGTLANWRSQGRGPSFVKVGSKVLYPVDKLEEWERLQLRAANDNKQADNRAA